MKTHTAQRIVPRRLRSGVSRLPRAFRLKPPRAPPAESRKRCANALRKTGLEVSDCFDLCE